MPRSRSIPPCGATITWSVLALVLLGIVPSSSAGDVIASTTVTTYTYNADGAPTAITTQVDGGESSTVYLTWDNFVPDADDPTTGTVSLDDGNLAAAGDTPSSTATTYAFDRRDRLVGYAAGAQSLTYAYHPDGTMASSTTADGAGFAFYYDGGRLARLLNMREQSGDLWSARLGPVRHVSDGSAQSLLTPRKEVAGAYDPSGPTLSAYGYDAYGAETTTTTSYDIHDNPFRYAGEYRDALWQGQYLRARWYDPLRPTFLSRDPLAHLNRYGYGDANPVMMSDPGGMKANSWKQFKRGFGRAVDWLDSGVQGHFARLFLSPVLYPLEIVAHPGRFWHQMERDPAQVAFVGVSLVAAGIGKLAQASLSVLELQQTLIGSVQSLVAGFGDFRGARRLHFDATAFLDSLESSVGASFLHADVGVVRSNPYRLSIDDVERLRSGLRGNEALVFRVRDTTGWYKTWTSPLLEMQNLGLYHEALIAITRDTTLVTEVLQEDERPFVSTHIDATGAGGIAAVFDRNAADRSGNLSFSNVGKTAQLDLERFFANPPDFEMRGHGRFVGANPQAGDPTGKYGLLTNNCHHHIAAVLKLLRSRH